MMLPGWPLSVPGYGHSYWAERTPSRRRPSFPAFRGERTADVVVIGGGLTGATAAYVLAAGGLDVVLLEADRLASGATALGLGAILPEPDAAFRQVDATLGLRAARSAWSMTRRAALDFASAIRKVGRQSGLELHSELLVARTGEAAGTLRREQAARKAAGLDAAWLTQGAGRAQAGMDVSGAIRLREAFVHDPVRTTLAFTTEAAARGAAVFERSPVRRTRFTRKEASVVLATGSIRTRCVLVATGAPGTLFSQLRRHVHTRDGYVVVTEPWNAAMRRSAGARTSVIGEPGPDARWLRWLPDDRVLFAGAASPMVPVRQRDKMLVQRTGQLMYELSVRYPEISGLPAHWSWRAPIACTPDGLPWIGPHRNYPFHFFAMAFGWHGDAFAWYAAKAALRYLKGTVGKEERVFGFLRG
jgi:glycine/D-amino acid oxidase-like deaminating enzyme